MNNKMLQYLTKHPDTFLKHKLTGKLPATITPQSPLINLIESIPRRYWILYSGVKINPSLGYNCVNVFASLEQLYLWLKPSKIIIGTGYYPAGSYQIQRFNKSLKIEDLQKATHSFQKIKCSLEVLRG